MYSLPVIILKNNILNNVIYTMFCKTNLNIFCVHTHWETDTNQNKNVLCDNRRYKNWLFQYIVKQSIC